ncbi:hypothetical protein [Pseudomonas entomophila]|uniref:hypothetical protein n=1 Tax=Pseudomonas entomophila TaxID=312306 RepID=UPI001F0151DB|nr:hypothetical protein [Pseudomonas entomophila]MCG8291911.1 hypothetical protein [Pseudomonas entomophila]
MIDAQTLKRLDDLATAIHGEGTTVEMLNRWAAFEAACKPELIRAMIAEITSLTPPAGQVSYREQMEAWKMASSQDLRARGELMIQVEELEAENEAMRKDAGRYRWLREHHWLCEKDVDRKIAAWNGSKEERK